MNRSEHDANRHLSQFVTQVDEVIQQAIEKADKGRFVVATSEPEMCCYCRTLTPL